jgi:hypothetical protein
MSRSINHKVLWSDLSVALLGIMLAGYEQNNASDGRRSGITTPDTGLNAANTATAPASVALFTNAAKTWKQVMAANANLGGFYRLLKSGNTRARDWYERRGFRVEATTCFGSKELMNTPTLPSDEFQPLGWEAAEAWQKRYGFS